MLSRSLCALHVLLCTEGREEIKASFSRLALKKCRIHRFCQSSDFFRQPDAEKKFEGIYFGETLVFTLCTKTGTNGYKQP